MRGLLLHGPPGCGKTLLARELSRRLGARPPKLVSGPEILDKWVGEAERKVRLLFLDAELDHERCVCGSMGVLGTAGGGRGNNRYIVLRACFSTVLYICISTSARLLTAPLSSHRGVGTREMGRVVVGALGAGNGGGG